MSAPFKNDSWPWADDLDALVAAPAHHKLVLEDDRVRVIDTKIPPGERTAVHTHRYPSILYIVSAGTFLRYDAEGQVITDSRAMPPQVAPSAFRVPPMPPHSVENIGTTLVHLVNVEFKNEEAV
jgi:quercetin dioxygenase-like cupin family protein